MKLGTASLGYLRVLLTLVATALTLATASPALGFWYAPQSVVPSGKVGVSRPAIGIALGKDPGNRLRAFVILDGTRHAAPITATGAFFIPSLPLEPGRHVAVIEITGTEFSQNTPMTLLRKTTVFWVLPGAESVLPRSSAISVGALETLNKVRRKLGLTPIGFDPALQAASAVHAYYVTEHPSAYTGGASPHSEPDAGASGSEPVKPPETDLLRP